MTAAQSGFREGGACSLLTLRAVNTVELVVVLLLRVVISRLWTCVAAALKLELGPR